MRSIKLNDTNLAIATDDNDKMILIGMIGMTLSQEAAMEKLSPALVAKYFPTTNTEVQEDTMNTSTDTSNTRTDFFENSYPADEVIDYKGYAWLPKTKGDKKFCGKTITNISKLSKALIAEIAETMMDHAVAAAAKEQKEYQEQLEKKCSAEDKATGELTHDQQVILFWQDIGWDKSRLNEGQMKWARSIAKHVKLSDNSRQLEDGSMKKCWSISWDNNYYRTQKGKMAKGGRTNVLRAVMQSWERAAQDKGLRTNMRPTGLVIYFK